jgi:hypothetical protein
MILVKTPKIYRCRDPTRTASILLFPFFIIAKKRGHGTRRSASDGRDFKRLLRHIIQHF